MSRAISKKGKKTRIGKENNTIQDKKMKAKPKRNKNKYHYSQERTNERKIKSCGFL
jgi:hypothetical protein